MSTDPAGVTRHWFLAANYGQGPQAGDARLQSGGALPFLLAVRPPPPSDPALLSAQRKHGDGPFALG